MVLRAPTPEEPGLPKVSIFRVHGDTESGGPPGARLVVSREELNGQEECNNTDLTMETDASMLGWGTVCQGSRTRELWFQTERRSHKNYLELLAAWFGVRAFAKDKRNIHIHLKMDNRTVVFYVNQMGRTHFPMLSNLAIQLWQWRASTPTESGSGLQLTNCFN